MWSASVMLSTARLARLTKILVLLGLVFVTSVSATGDCELATPQWSDMELQTVRLVRVDGKVVRLRSRIADSPRERSAGFQHICPQIIQLSYILFVFEQPIKTRFHMFNVHDSLDIGFFDRDRQLISVLTMTPQKVGDPSSQTYGIGAREFMFALEAKAGFFEENGLKPSETILDYP